MSSDGNEKPLLALGEAFVPGSDKSHFCQPTDVAVDPDTGNIYVSDGYCNTRILTFSPEGKYLSHWGAGIHPATQTWESLHPILEKTIKHCIRHNTLRLCDSKCCDIRFVKNNLS